MNRESRHTGSQFPSTVADNVGGALLIAGAITLRPALLRWLRSWGATRDECLLRLPGDALVPTPRYEINQAITLDAPPERVYPWLRQIGQGRAGLYSYERLENLAGCDMHDAGRLVPELQHLAPGDLVRFGPEGYPAMVVAEVTPPRALVLRTPPNPAGARGSWAFVLTPEGERSTRLISRYRGDYSPTLGQRVIWRGLTEPINAVMARRMLLGLKARVEART